MKKGELTLEEIRDELFPKCLKFCEPVFGKWDKDEQYYELNFKELLGLPKEFENEGIVLPTARDMVDTFVDHIDISNARVFANRKGTSNISAEEAEMMRKFYLGLIHRTNVESDISPWRVLAKHYALHGLGVCKTIYDADRWPSKPDQKRGESEEAYSERVDEWRATRGYQSLPIVIQAVHPRCILPDPSYGGRMFIFERHERLCLDISKRWPHWNNPKGKKPHEEVELLSYWDADYRCELVDGEPILKGGVVKHNYGFIPYVLIDSGLGNISYENKPEMRYVGLLRYMFDVLISQSRDYSIEDIVLGREAWPWYTVEGDRAAEVMSIDQMYGQPNRLPPGTTIKFQTPQITPAALAEHFYRTTYAIDAHAAPRSLRGLPEPGVRAAAHQRLMTAEAGARYRYSEDAFKNGTAKILTNCATLMKNVIPGSVRLWSRTPSDEFDVVIDKDKMREPFTCYVEFAPISEEDEYRRHDDLERLVASGIVPKKWARQQMSNVDPMALELQEEKEMIRQLPAYIEIKQQYAAGEFAKAISKRQGAEAIMPIVGQAGTETPRQPGRRLAPPIPERAAPGSGEEMQLSMAQQRSQTPISPTQGMGGGGAR